MTTTSATPIRFGVVGDGYHDVADPTGAGDRLARQAADAEMLGYDVFSLSDHLHGQRPTFDPWTALTWVAAATTGIDVMPNVLGLPYRHPAVLAKMAETLDRLTGGRLILGIGNGGYDAEFDAFGLPRRRPGEKVDALGEALHVIADLWVGSVSTFSGTHYQTVGAQLQPAPRRRIPIWIGGYGQRSLRQTGQLADGWLPSLGRITLTEAATMRDTVRAAATDAGRDPDTLTYAINLTIQPPTATPSADTAAALSTVRRVVDAGFTTLLIAGLNTPDTRRWFAHDVIAQIRAHA